MEKKSLGAKGEAIAGEYLKKKGYKILAQNYRCYLGEIDLIAQKGDALTFIEVKLRTSLDYGFPQESVVHRKQVRIRRVATYYLKEQNLWDRVDCHFDVLAIYTEKKKIMVEHIKDAF